MRQTIYRDTKTGRFAKQTTWKRSIAQGGDRYKRQSVVIERKREIIGGEPRGIVLRDLDEYLEHNDYEGEEEAQGGIDTGKAKKK